MAGTYTKTITFAGPNNPNGDNYTWIDVSGAVSQGWISYSQRTGTEQWDFTIETWTNPSSASRSADFKAKHWQWTNDSQTSLWDSFTITQYNDNSIEVTTTEATTTDATTTIFVATTTAFVPTTTAFVPTTTAYVPPTTVYVPPTTVYVPPTTQVPTYTLTYDANGGSGSGTGPTTGTLPLTVASNPYNKTGYSFTEWNTGSSGNGSGYAEGASYNVAANATLYAQWSINPTTETPTTETPTTETPTTTQLPTPAVFIDGYEEFYESGTSEQYTANISNINNPSYSWSKTGNRFAIFGGSTGSSVEIEYFGTASCSGDGDAGSVTVEVTGTNLAGNPVTVSDTLILFGCDTGGGSGG